MLLAQSKWILIALLAGTAAGHAAHGAPVPDLYVAQVPATAFSGPALDEAFGLALDQVLVKATGQRGIAIEPDRRRAVGPPGPLVRRYQPVGGGQVRVSFDPAALRRRLDAANLPVWADDRPRALVFLPPDPPDPPVVPAAVAGADVSPTAVDRARSSGQLFLAAAASRGVPVVLAPEPAGGSRTGGDPLLDPEATARAAGADLLLIGRPVPASGSGLLRWTLVQSGSQAEWQGDAADGAQGLADRLAARYATSATEGRTLRLRITGVDSFDAYGRLQSYLRSVGLIQDAELKEITAGELVFELSVRGDVGHLNDAFALRRVLEPAGDEAGAGGLFYRLASASSLPAP